MTGKPSISSYDVRYRVQGYAPWSIMYDRTKIAGFAMGQVLATSVLENLIAGTTYEVELRATNDEGTSAWSDAGTGTTAAEVRESNPSPVFDEGTAAFRQVAEDSGPGSAVGEPVVATDANDETLAYSLGGADEFTVDAASGQIRVASGVVLDFEAQPSYTVTLRVSDGKDIDGNADATADATISVTIDLTDVNEPPPTPAAPFVITPSSGAQTSLDVFWSAPDMTGKPPITDYEVRYRVQGSSGWSGGAYRGIDTSTTLIGLFAGATYEVQVLASNAEGSSGWSASGTRTTAAAQQKSGPNQAPTFDQGAPVVRKVAENSAAGTALGAPVTAFDPDGDTLIYSLIDADQQFTISAAGGQISVAPGARLDFEKQASYTVTVSASDGRDADGGANATVDAEVSVSIELIDVAELPTAPAAPVVRRSSSDPETSLDVSWKAPDMSGKPRITDYDVRYRAQGSIGWSNANHNGPGIEVKLDRLTAGTAYEVQVLARNADGSSPWSASGRTALKDYEPAPAFDEGAAATRRVAENSAAGTPVGAPVTATDANDSALTYTLSGAVEFTIDAATGQIRVASGARPDHEAQPSYTVTVSVSDGKDRTGEADAATDAEISVTIEVRDVPEPPPAVGTPLVTRPAANRETSLHVKWVPPNMSGKPPITGYDVQYRESDTTAWIPHPFSGTGVETTITRLQESTRYVVRVRAKNKEGDGAWSPVKATLPTVQISGPSETQTGRFAVHFTVMPEDVADFDGADVDVTNGSVESFEHLGRGTYVARITPDGTGTVTVRVLAGKFHDKDDKANRASSLYQVEVEDSVPSVPAEVSFALEENRAGPVVLGAISDGTPQGAGGWTYKIASGAAGKFEIEAQTGRLSYVGDGEDYETPPSSYTLTVTTTSVSGRTASTVVTVHVVNVNEPPQPVGQLASWVMHSGASVTFNSEPYFVDPDGDSLQYEADSSDPVVATVKTSSPPVTITAQAEGRTTVTVTTCDPAGECAEQEMEVRVLEDDINFIPKELEVKEGTQETYTVNLLYVPPGRVTITLASSDPGVATVSPERLFFDPGTWDLPQTVTVTAVADADHLDETVLVTHTARGVGYEGSAVFTVTVEDDDVAGVTVSPSALRMDDGTTLRGYAVVLDTLPAGPVTITPASGDPGTLGVKPERLTFTPDNWDQPQQVTLTSSELQATANRTVRVRHQVSGADYEEVEAATVAVTVVDDEYEPRSALAAHWMARFGRSVADNTVDTMRARFAAAHGESYVTVGGRHLAELANTVPAEAAGAHATAAGPDPSLGRLLAASAFQQDLSVAGAEPDGFRPGLALWGRGAVTGFEGRPSDDLDLTGEVLAGHVGADYRFSRQLQVGLAVSYAGGAGDVAEREASADADVTSWLVSGHPYLHFAPLEQLAVWVALGLGYGEMELDEDPTPVRPALAMYLAAVGIDGTLLSLQQFELALNADAYAMRMESDETAALEALSVDVQRARLMLEGRVAWALSAVSRLEPYLELGARYDHGDAENGIGGELGGGLAFVDTALGLQVGAHGRFLLVHQERAFRQWGAGLEVSLAPGRGEGLSLSLVPTWGVVASHVDTLLHDGGQVAASGAGERLRSPDWQPDQVDLAFGYGVKVGEDSLLTPFGELGLTRGTSRMRAGLRLGGADAPATAAPLEVYVERDTTTQNPADPQYHLGVSASIRS